jgi:hypothetical protein
MSTKMVRRLEPEVSMAAPASLNIQFAGQMTGSAPINWEPAISFDPVTDYHVDATTTGRYLAIRFTFPELVDCEVSGFDLDVVANGR